MLNAAQLRLQAEGRRRRIGEHVLERIVRLNPEYEPGQILRGYRPSQCDMRDRVCYGDWTHGQFIRRYGRENWDKLPSEVIIKHGRRKFVRREAIEDCLWMRA